MEVAAFKSKIESTFSDVRDFSFEEKKSPLMSEEKINALLDKILSFKETLSSQTDRILEIVDSLEELTWYDERSDEEVLKSLNDLISSCKDLRSSLIRQYIAFEPLRTRNLANEEIKAFKYAIDELKETYEDLESVFFYLPAMPEFEETTRQLSLV